MKSYVISGPRTGEVVTVPDPEAGANQAVIRVIANGVCASDLPEWTRPQPSYPIRIGHEPVGEVVARGPGVNLALGTFVTGRITPSLSEYAVADAGDIVTIPGSLDPDDVLGEPLGCVVEAYRRTRLGVGDRVAVIGQGFMGLIMTQLLAHSCLSTLVAVDPRDDARRAAVANGADRAFAPAEVPRDFRVERAEDDGREAFDVVVEASGAQAGLDLATSLVRPHGAITILGFHQGQRTVAMDAWNVKALDVVNGHVRDPDLLRDATRRGVDMLAAGRLDLGRLITHRFPLGESAAAFTTLLDKPDGFIKSVVVCS